MSSSSNSSSGSGGTASSTSAPPASGRKLPPEVTGSCASSSVSVHDDGDGSSASNSTASSANSSGSGSGSESEWGTAASASGGRPSSAAARGKRPAAQRGGGRKKARTAAGSASSDAVLDLTGELEAGEAGSARAIRSKRVGKAPTSSAAASNRGSSAEPGRTRIQLQEEGKRTGFFRQLVELESAGDTAGILARLARVRSLPVNVGHGRLDFTAKWDEQQRGMLAFVMDPRRTPKEYADKHGSLHFLTHLLMVARHLAGSHSAAAAGGAGSAGAAGGSGFDTKAILREHCTVPADVPIHGSKSKGHPDHCRCAFGGDHEGKRGTRHTCNCSACKL
jgi:hypothetical protein